MSGLALYTWILDFFWHSLCLDNVYRFTSGSEVLLYYFSTHLSAHIERLHHLLQIYDDLVHSVKAYVAQFPYLALDTCSALLEAPRR